MNAFDLDFPAHIWAPLPRGVPQSRAHGLSDLSSGDRGHLLLLSEGGASAQLHSVRGRQRSGQLNVYGPGSLFGEASFFDELPRVSSAVALTSCEIVAIDRELVTEEIEKDPELALAMMKYLARTVRLLSTQLDQMAFRPAQWRIARYLLSLSPTGGPVRCTQEDIASSVSASRVTVSRVLNQLARQGIIELGYSTIFVWDIEALKKTCQN